ncbi:MAG: GHKL domain-containing protein [Clostridia bacterium]|nr:GHKL domain-containing protein [Clostridia bacterium]
MVSNGRKVSFSEDAGKVWRIALYAVLFLGVLALCVLYIRLASTPLDSFDISPVGSLARWRFSLEDGTEITPANGELPLAGPDAVVLCQTQLTEYLTNHPYFVVTANYADCVIYINDKMVYAPSGRFADGHFSAVKYAAAAASGQFIARLTGEGDILTMRVQFQGEDSLVKHLPRLTLYFDQMYYRSQTIATTAEAAFPAGMFFALALFLSALFFIGIWKDKQDTGLLLLTFCALSMALTSTTSYTVSVAWTLLWASVSVFCSLLPLIAMGWALWYRLSRRPRLVMLPVIGLVNAVLLYYLIAGFGQSNTLNVQINILQIWVVPGSVFLTLLVAAIDAMKGNAWFRRFFRFLALSVPAVVLAWAFSTLTGGKLAQTMAAAIQRLVDYRSLFKLCELLCILMLIIMFIKAVLDLISGLAQRDAEMKALALREKYAVENMKLMLETQESTRRERHEMRHHVAFISEMLSSGQQERAQTYASSLLDKINMLPSDTYCTNPIINAIVGRYLNGAREAGITVTSDIRAANKVVLPDDELCVLLTNMLENALEACMKMPSQSERFIRFKLRVSEKHLTVSCENSSDIHDVIAPDASIPSTKSDAKDHGYGIPAMRRIIEKNGGVFTLSNQDGCFTVKMFI